MSEWEQRDTIEPTPLTFEGLRKLRAQILQIELDEMQRLHKYLQKHRDNRRPKQDGKSTLDVPGGVLGG